jgi:hypothetical protein
METIRELLQKGLVTSLNALPEEDLFALAWPVACGPTMARRGEVVQYKEGVVRVLVTDHAWAQQMKSTSGVLQSKLALITGMPVTRIHFEVRGSGRHANSQPF